MDVLTRTKASIAARAHKAEHMLERSVQSRGGIVEPQKPCLTGSAYGPAAAANCLYIHLQRICPGGWQFQSDGLPGLSGSGGRDTALRIDQSVGNREGDRLSLRIGDGESHQGFRT